MKTFARMLLAGALVCGPAMAQQALPGPGAIPLVQPKGTILFSGDSSGASDVSAALNAAITASNGGTVQLGAGTFSVCASSLNFPVATSFRLIGGGKAATTIRVLPGCSSGITTVLSQPSSTNIEARLTLSDLTIDGYGIAANDLNIIYAIDPVSTNVVYRNVAPGGTNVLIQGGYQAFFDASNEIENVNDAGHTLYFETTATTDANSGATSVTVASATNISNGMTVIIPGGGAGGAATTGTVTANSNSLAVVSASGMAVGNMIEIEGAGTGGSLFTTQIIAVSGTTITLANPVVTAVSGATTVIPGSDLSSTVTISGTTLTLGTALGTKIPVGSIITSLPKYNLQQSGTDGWFEFAAHNAYMANFYQTTDGNDYYIGAHAWGNQSPPLQAQYGFLITGNATLQSASVDDPLYASFRNIPGAMNLGARFNSPTCNYTGAPANTLLGCIVLDSGIAFTAQSDVISANLPPSQLIVQSGVSGGSVAGGFAFGPGLGSQFIKISWSLPSSIGLSGVVTGITQSATAFYVIPQGGTNFPIVTISPPPNGGAQAAVVINSMEVGGYGSVIAGGTGYTNGCSVTLPGGTPITGPYTATVTSSGGIVSALNYSANGLYTVMPAELAGQNTSWVNGTCTGSGLTTHGLSWEVFNGTSYTITAQGSGYSSATGTVTTGPAMTNAFGSTTIGVTIGNFATSAGSGGLYLCVDNTGKPYLKSACP